MRLTCQGLRRLVHQLKPQIKNTLDQLHFPGIDMRLIWCGWVACATEQLRCHNTARVCSNRLVLFVAVIAKEIINFNARLTLGLQFLMTPKCPL